MMEIYASTRVLIYFKLFSAKLSRQAVKFSNSRRRLRPSDLCSHVSTSTTTELTEAILRTCYIPCTPFQRFRMSGWLCVRLCMSFFCGSLLYVFLHAFYVFLLSSFAWPVWPIDYLLAIVKSYISFFNVFVCLAARLWLCLYHVRICIQLILLWLFLYARFLLSSFAWVQCDQNVPFKKMNEELP